MLGEGGMGVVYEGHDPALDRAVAIKVVRPGSAATSARLLREAKRLARLSHPNVVVIYEVGDLDGEVFFAMEPLRGGNLRDWLDARPRSWREVAGMMLRVGRGLAAAHDVGLIHRDFKPDNILLGDDGRPRVVDFGLTQEVGSAMDLVTAASLPTPSSRGETRASGTPAYMAPEQRRGIATKSSDQFSFCVVLHEALLGSRPGLEDEPRIQRHFPRGRPSPAVLRALRRGLSENPDDRFEDMPALLQALERGTRRRWWPVPVAATALGAVGLVAVASEESAVPRAASGPCREVQGLIDTAKRQAPTAENLSASIAQYLDASTAVTDSACDEDGAFEGRADEVLTCVRSNTLLVTALERLHRDGAISEARALDAARHLPDPTSCEDLGRLLGTPPPPVDPVFAAAQRALLDDIEQAKLLRIAGLEEQARAGIDDALRTAQSIASPTAEALAQLELARLHSIDGNPEPSITALRQAVVAAERAGHQRYKALALVELGGMLSSTGAFDQAEDALERAGATLDRLGNPPTLNCEYEQMRGFVAFRANRLPKSIEHLRRAIALREALGHWNEFALVGPVNMLGAALARAERFDEATAAFERARDLVAEHHGDDHPLMGRVLNNLAEALSSSGDLEQARRVSARALATHERNLREDHPSILIARTNLAQLELSLGHIDAGREHAETALTDAERIHGPDSPEIRFALLAAARASALAGERAVALARVSRAEQLVEEAWGAVSPQNSEIAPLVAEILASCGATDEHATDERTRPSRP